MTQQLPSASLPGERGSTMVEAVLVLPLFLFLTYATMSIAYAGYQALAVRFSLEYAARYAIVGDSPPLVSREQAIVDRVMTMAAALSVPVEATHVRICPQAMNCSGANHAGGPGAVIQLSVERPLTVVFFGGAIAYTASVEVRNEEFI